MVIPHIELISIGALKPNLRNARTHSKKQVKQIAESISKFGFTNPLLVDNENMVLAGHGRLAAAQLLAMDNVPCVRLGTLSAAQKRAYVLADNKLALNAGWDEEILAMELEELLELDLEINIELTGFSIAEIDSLIEGRAPEESGDPKDEKLPEIGLGPAVSQLGDVWQLGPHRLVCGDALSPQTCNTLLEGKQVQMVFTDPPYNVPIAGHVGGLGAVKHREFAMASGEMTPAEFTAFLKSAFQNLADNSVDGSIHFICMDWRHMAEILAAGTAVYAELKNLIVWAKDNGGMGTFYRSRHELIFAFKKGTAPHINSFELGQFGRYRTNVWQYAGANSLKTGRMDELTLHVSKRHDIVLDLFGGSGSTLIAAHKTGRRGFLVELDPIYCDRIVRRWETYAKDDALLASSGKSFAEISAERSQMALTETITGSADRATIAKATADQKGKLSGPPPSLAGIGGQ